jgi:hypothetical protein
MSLFAPLIITSLMHMEEYCQCVCLIGWCGGRKWATANTLNEQTNNTLSAAVFSNSHTRTQHAGERSEMRTEAEPSYNK